MTGSLIRWVPSLEIGYRKRHPKFGSPRRRFQFNLPIVALDQAPHDVQPESGTFTHRLRCKKRIENAIAKLLGNARSVIHNTDRYVVTFASGCNFDLATLVDRIQRIIDQI